MSPADGADAPLSWLADPNPWRFNFDVGMHSSNPPDFCRYCNCIANFASGRGYVVQCADLVFSKSAGLPGS